MTQRLCVPLLLALIVSIGIGSAFTPVTASGIGRADLLKLKINAYRAEQGLPALKKSTTLTLVAKERARQTFAYGYFTHGNTVVQTYRQILARYRFRVTTSGENLAKNTKTTSDTLTFWKNSSSHRRNLLGKTFTHVGIAVITGTFNGKRTTITVAVFAKKAQ